MADTGGPAGPGSGDVGGPIGGIGEPGGPGEIGGVGPVGPGADMGPVGGGVGPDVGPDTMGPTGGGPAIPDEGATAPNNTVTKDPYIPFQIDPNQVKKDIAMGWAWGVPQAMMPGTMPFGMGLQMSISPQVFGPSSYSDGIITAPKYGSQSQVNYQQGAPFSLMDYLGGFK